MCTGLSVKSVTWLLQGLWGCVNSEAIFKNPFENWVAEGVASKVNNFTAQVSRANNLYLYSMKYEERKQKM